MNIEPLRAFTDSLRIEGAGLRHRGLSEMADVLESVANDHEQMVDAWHTESLTLHQAAEESGFSSSSLQQSVASGKIANAGRQGFPRIRRCDLPSKSRGSGPRAVEGPLDLADEILRSKLGRE